MAAYVRSARVRSRIGAAMRKLDQIEAVANELGDGAAYLMEGDFNVARGVARDFRKIAERIGPIRRAMLSAWVAYNEQAGVTRREPYHARPRMIHSRPRRELSFREFRRRVGAGTERLIRYVHQAQAILGGAALYAATSAAEPDQKFQRAISGCVTWLDPIPRMVRALQIVTQAPRPLDPDAPRSAWGADEIEAKHHRTSARRARAYQRRRRANRSAL